MDERRFEGNDFFDWISGRDCLGSCRMMEETGGTFIEKNPLGGSIGRYVAAWAPTRDDGASADV